MTFDLHIVSSGLAAIERRIERARARRLALGYSEEEIDALLEPLRLQVAELRQELALLEQLAPVTEAMIEAVGSGAEGETSA